LRAMAAMSSTILLVGCAGMQYAMDNYTGVPVQQFTASSGAHYRIFDKPKENRLMITPSLAAAAGGGAVQGLTFGAVNPASAAVVFRDAAQEYLATTGRTCETKDTTLVVNPQYEVRYQCSTLSSSGPPSLAQSNAEELSDRTPPKLS
jgi:hypothetical protein